MQDNQSDGSEDPPYENREAKPMIARRSLIAGFIGATAAILIGTSPGHALEEAEARAHVEKAVAEVLDVVQMGGDTSTKADKLRGVMEKRAAMPQIARFSAGLAWRDMTEDQQARFTAAFSHAIAVIYARRFQTYAGEKVNVGAVTDNGRRGLLVSSSVTQASGAPLTVDWLVSDRPGRVVIADIIIEGVSLLLTQRDEIAGMLGKRNGDLDKLIEDLKAI